MSQISTYTREQKRALNWASRDRYSFGEHLRPIVTLGKDTYHREDLVSCSYGGDDGYAVLASLSFRARLPRDAEQKPLRIDFEVDAPWGTVRLPGFAGYAIRRRERGFALTGATGGYEAERVPLGDGPGQDLAFSKTRPDLALFNAMSRLRRRYAGYEFPTIENPKLTRQGADRLTWNLYVKEAADYCAEAAKLVIADTPTNTAFAYQVRNLAREEPPAWHFEKGVDCEEIGDETPEGERYASVVIHSEPMPDGRITVLARAAVDNHGYDVYAGSTFMHALDPETDPDSASVTAYRIARTFGRNDAEITAEPNYPPFFLRRGDVVTATGKDFRLVEERPGRASRGQPAGILRLYRFLFRVETFEVNALEMSGSVAGEGRLLGTEEKPMSLPDFSERGFMPLWGTSPDTDLGMFDTALPWVEYDPDRGVVVLDEEEAARHGVDVEPSDDDDTIIEVDRW